MEKFKFSNRYFLMPVTLIVFLVSFYLVYVDIKNRTINEYKNEQLILAKTASQGITSVFNDYRSNLSYLAQFRDIIHFTDDSKSLMKSFYVHHQNIIAAITRVDEKGTIIYTYPYNREVIGTNIMYQEHIRKIIKTHQPVISDVFIAEQGYLAIAMHVPVFDGNNFKGSLAVLILIDKLGKLYLENMSITKTGTSALLSENGIELYCPIPGHTGKSILEITNNDTTTRILLNRIRKQNSGMVKGIHQKVMNQDKHRPDEMYVVFYRTPLGNTYWTILISFEKKAVYNDIARLRNRLILIFTLLILIILFYFYSLVKARNVLREENKRKKAEKTLQESEEKFRRIFEDHAAVKMLVDPYSGSIIDANKSASAYYGWSREELKHMNIGQINTLTAEELKVCMMKTMSENGIQSEFRHRLKDGSIRDVEVSSSPIKIGNRMLLHSIVHDITERKRIEEALRESENRFRKVVEQAPIAMAIVGMDGKIEFINDKAIKVFGYNHEDIPDMDTWWLKAYPDNAYRNQVVSEWMDRVQKALQGHTEINGTEYQVTCKDGTLKTAYISGASVLNKIFVLFDDITERKMVEQALRESEERFSKAYMTSPISFMIANMEDGKIIEVNDAFITVSGYSREEALSSSTLELNIWVNENDRKNMIKSLQSGHPVVRQETLLRGKNGNILTALLSAQIIQLGHKFCIISSIEDITEQKKAEIEIIKAKERAEESDRLKTAFLQNMSHEIRTPMNAIMGFSSLLVESYNDRAKLEKYSEIIRQRSSDLLEIINDILDISKIESGQLPLNVEECDLNELFSELTSFFKEFQHRIGKQQIKFKLESQCNPPENRILTDKVKLRQIFINLINNAFKFTEEGHIEGGCFIDANKTPLFYVTDTGMGIPPDKHEIIFDRFIQLRHNKNISFGGTGLGLAIVKGLVGIMGGKIWLESEPENPAEGKAGGTTFYFTLPYIMAEPSEKTEIVTGDTGDYKFNNTKVLIVEDDFFNREYIRAILSHTDLALLYTAYGKEAVQIASSESPDLVLMDIRLPDMTGYEATRLIKKQNPKIKVIIQTAYAAYEDSQKARDAGCDDYISKPVKRDDLLSLIYKHAAKK